MTRKNSLECVFLASFLSFLKPTYSCFEIIKERRFFCKGIFVSNSPFLRFLRCVVSKICFKVFGFVVFFSDVVIKSKISHEKLMMVCSLEKIIDCRQARQGNWNKHR